ncbi:glycosyl hydrolase [Diaporthe helianthi]|uniref:Glycosyl hydrolase n=1 Tax=Diaporthe helianthi TaxID=158607 RepID=A0A2P5HMY4_DIAHE|nr:glycosyl hydrolase [Diaporthe helianthi]
MSLTSAVQTDVLLSSTVAAADLSSYVLPSTGQQNGGNTFPGVSWPLGIVKLGPDLYDGTDAYSGYKPDGNFTGFSMLHESGTGGAPKYGVVSQMPVLGDIFNPLADHNDTRRSPDLSEVGYYQSFLGSGITVELAGTERAGFYQYSFPNNNQTRNVIVDVSHVLSSYRGMGLQQSYLGGNIEVVGGNTKAGFYKGYGSYDNGWNRAPEWTVYFCGHFDPPPSAYRTFLGTGNTNSSLVEYPAGDNVTSTSRLGVLYTFDGATNVTSRVGVSFISTEQACSNVDSQIPSGITREELTAQTKDAWNREVLSKVTTTDTRNPTDLQLLYSSLYHLSIIPTNKTGENPLWTSSEPYYDDIFTLWDLFRCGTALFHIIQPVAHTELIRSLIDVWRNEGYMPDGRSSFWNGATQGGSNCDNVLADAYVKGVQGGVNWEDGYSAMRKNAEVTPAHNNDARDPTGSTKEGRGALPDWLGYGFITPSFGRSVSRVVEYSVNDFAVYTVGDGLGDANALTYLNRSRNWRNHWNPAAESLGFSGFLVPRNLSGFIEQDPLSCGGCYWADYFYQGLPWEYSCNAHHDIDTLISYSGGEANFVKRLQMMFTPGVYPSGSFDQMIFNPGNEPSFTTPYLFNFVNRQDLTVYYTRKFARAYYSPTPGGLPGNSDAGAMESWVLWVMLGLYPMTGQTTFLIGSPWFSDLTISLSDGKKLDITTTGGNETSYYVQSLKVNGQVWDKAWVTWSDIFQNGGTMDFTLGPFPSNWTTGPPPPSPGTEAAVQRPR